LGPPFLFLPYPTSQVSKYKDDIKFMKDFLLITCQKCGYMINGRPWRCPGCGGANDNHKSGKSSKTRPGFLSMTIAAFLGARKPRR